MTWLAIAISVAVVVLLLPIRERETPYRRIKNAKYLGAARGVWRVR